MKLKRGKSEIIYFPEEGEPLGRAAMLKMVQGKSLTEGKDIVAEHQKITETAWVDKWGQVQARSQSPLVLAVSITPINAEETQRELMDELKAGLEAISREDASLEDVRKALRAQIAYSEFMDQVND